MDINLPGIAGIECTRRLQRDEGQPVVLLLSTYDDIANATVSRMMPLRDSQRLVSTALLTVANGPTAQRFRKA